jgi:Flp pilus assembly protein TadG
MREERSRARRADERGVALVWMAIVTFLLLGIAAIAVDLVHGLLVSQQAQNAADAASLGGAVYLPADPGTAKDAALDIAGDNGFQDGFDGAVVVATQQPDPTKLKVEVSKTVDTFFAKAIGFATLTIRESAIADYDPPVSMGSPANAFGNQPDCPNCSTAPVNPATGGRDPQLWANVEGPLSPKSNGNAYTANSCASSADRCSGSNLDLDPNGYFYAVKNRGVSSPLHIDVFDAPFVHVGNTCGDGSLGTLYIQRVAAADPDAPHYWPGKWSSSPAQGQYCTGDSFLGTYDPANPPAPTVTKFTVLAPDDTPWDLSNNPAAPCSAGSANKTVSGYKKAEDAWNDAGDGRQMFRKWATLCTIGSPAIGDYIVQVQTTSGNGNNNFSLRAYGGGTEHADTNVSVAGTSRIGIFVNSETPQTQFFLARVLPGSTSRTLTLNFYDIADASTSGSLQVLPPTGATVNGTALTQFSGCTYTDPSRPYSNAGLPIGAFSSTGSGCMVSGISLATYQAKWVTWKIPIPAGYNCNQNDPFDCWLRISYTGFGNAQDVTSWQARLDGNPVRIVK